VILDALRSLRVAGLEGSFRLRVLGGVDAELSSELEGYAGIEVPWIYRRDQLDGLLDDVDVGIMPSIWEEAFAYAGVEMLAKGIPLIANPVGGIVEYARDGETAWLNRSCSGRGLSDIMARLIAEPDRVVEMHERVLAARSALVRPMDEHVDAIERIYREASDAPPQPDLVR
jgi:glycosyltransferase involved in cell wall biosynthesis